MDFLLRKKMFLFLILGGLVLIGDQASKMLIRLHGGFYFCNPHIAFGIEIPAFFFWTFWPGVVLLCLFAFYKEYPSFNSLCLMLVFSGAISNLVDRLRLGCVVDFIHLGFGPVFNLADFFISLGVIMLVINYLKTKR